MARNGERPEHRVVVTGMGVLAPNGNNLVEFWDSLIEGRSGLGIATSFDVSDLPVKTVAELKNFDPRKYMDFKEAKRMARFSQVGVAAAKMAIDQSGLELAKEDRTRIGCEVGTGIGGFKEISEANNVLGDPEKRKQYDEMRRLGAERGVDELVCAHRVLGLLRLTQGRVVDLRGNALYFSRGRIPFSRSGGFPAADQTKRRSGDRRSLFLRHQGIYGFRREALLQFVKWKPSPLEQAEALEQLRPLENGVRVHVLVTKHGSPSVDTPQDAKNVAASLREASDKSVKHRAPRVAQSATAIGRRIAR